ncbi:hypothetical protein DL96DRAFT_1578376 [Flagelloscypha sp. PMI_526]|nr:hypothetical protein DL96DRAFT_1578376 [Flagelloscypha sp. PMI_526]
MGRWTQYDEDDYRLPEGMKRVGYDADTQQYTYKDSAGQAWQGEPRAQYGTLNRVYHSPPSRHQETRRDRSNVLPRASSSQHVRSATQPAPSVSTFDPEALAAETPPRSTSRASHRLRSLSSSSLDQVATSLREKIAPVFRGVKRAFTVSKSHADQRTITDESVSSPRSSARSSKSKQSTRSSADGRTSYESGSSLARSNTLPTLPKVTKSHENGRKATRALSARDPMVWPSTLNRSMTSSYPEARASKPIPPLPSSPTSEEKTSRSSSSATSRHRLTKKPTEESPSTNSSARSRTRSGGREGTVVETTTATPPKSRHHAKTKSVEASPKALPESPSRRRHARSNSQKVSPSSASTPSSTHTPVSPPPKTPSKPSPAPSLPIYERYGSASTKVFTPFKPLTTPTTQSSTT